MPDWAHEVRQRLSLATGLTGEREAEIVKELSQHLEDFWQELIVGGASDEEATRITLAQFQSGTALGQHMAQLRQAQPRHRSTPGEPRRSLLRDLGQDVRFGARSLRRKPGFTVTALTILALAIGLNTAIFSLANGVVLQPLPYPQSRQLMYLSSRFPALGSMEFAISPPEYSDLREAAPWFADLGAFRTGEANVTAGSRALRVRSASVDEHLLSVLGARAEHGRVFAAGETNAAAPAGAGPGSSPEPPAIVILSYELWQTAFGGRPIVGQMVDVDGARREVIGVMAHGFDVADHRTEIWLPLGLNPASRQDRAAHNLLLIGRLKDGMTTDAAHAELNLLNAQWSSRVGLSPTDHVFATSGPNVHLLEMTALQDRIIGGAGRVIWVLQAAVAFVLLIAGTNLAGLLLARAEAGHRELALLTALGASRGRLIQQCLVESTLLSLLGGILGAGLARIAVPGLVRALPDTLPRTDTVTVDTTVLCFTLGVSVVTGLLFGLAPLIHTRVSGLVTAAKDGGSRGATAGARRRLRNGLVIAEVAVAMVLVTGAALLGRTVYNLVKVDPGFDRTRQITFSITLPRARYTAPGTRSRLYERVLDTLRTIPGVQDATAMVGLPPVRPRAAADLEIEKDTNPRPPNGPPRSIDYLQTVQSNYFETMGIPLVRGRSFQRRDATAGEMVAVINETLANTFWKDQNPVGKHLRPCCGDAFPWFTIVGVARDVKQGGVDQPPGSEFYADGEQASRFTEPSTFIRPGLLISPVTMHIVLRTGLASASLSPTIERVMREIDPDVPVVRLQEMEAVFAETIRRPRLLARLVGAFAGLSLLLAAIGTYGMLSVMIAERRPEIGIRMALGAQRRDVLLSVLLQGLALTGLGAAIGLAGAISVARMLSSLLFGVQPTDIPTLAAVTTTMALVALAACVRPAWHASRLDPNVVLRNST